MKRGWQEGNAPGESDDEQSSAKQPGLFANVEAVTVYRPVVDDGARVGFTSRLIRSIERVAHELAARSALNQTS